MAQEHLSALAAYLGEAQRIVFDWGGHDCFLFPADWVVLRRGVDPMARHRGHYHTRLGATRRMGRMSAQALWAGALDPLGLHQTDLAQTGDVGLVTLPVSGVTVGAIRTPSRWAMLTVRGLMCLSADRCGLIAAWRV